MSSAVLSNSYLYHSVFENVEYVHDRKKEAKCCLNPNIYELVLCLLGDIIRSKGRSSGSIIAKL